MIGREGPGPERSGPDYPPEWDREPEAGDYPPGSCPGCGHRWADHHERDGCGACALTFTRSCKRWPEELTC